MNLEQTLVGFGIMGLTIIVPLLIHKIKNKSKVDKIEVKDLRPIDHRGTNKRRVYGLDPTKRRTLQPGNKNIVPKGWEAVTVVDEKINAVLPTGTMHYKFFGSALVVGTNILVDSLPRTLHRVEITEKNELLIDNMSYKVHRDTVIELRKHIFKMQNN